MTEERNAKDAPDEPPRPEAEKPIEVIAAVEQAQFVVFLLVTIIGVASLLPILATRPTGFTATLAIPIAVGAIGGLFAKDGIWLLGAIGVLAGFCALGIALVMGDILGVFCGAVYCIVGIPPVMLVGLTVLWFRRRYRKKQSPSSRALLLWLAVPYVMFGIECLVPYEPVVESLAVTREISAPIERVWGQPLNFAEQSASPWALVAGPLPKHALGSASRVGDEKRIRFGKGDVLVRVVEIQPGRRLVADVLEQTIEMRALRLRRVVIACDPVAESTTRVWLAIEFEPLMRPRWYCRLFEPLFGGIAMEAVLDAWQDHAERPPTVVMR